MHLTSLSLFHGPFLLKLTPVCVFVRVRVCVGRVGHCGRLRVRTLDFSALLRAGVSPVRCAGARGGLVAL